MKKVDLDFYILFLVEQINRIMKTNRNRFWKITNIAKVQLEHVRMNPLVFTVPTAHKHNELAAMNPNGRIIEARRDVHKA